MTIKLALVLFEVTDHGLSQEEEVDSLQAALGTYYVEYGAAPLGVECPLEVGFEYPTASVADLQQGLAKALRKLEEG
jgi:hypothetical protein